MKTTTIFASAFILLALSISSFATDTSNKQLDTVASNAQGVSSALINNGRNNYLKSHQHNNILQLLSNENESMVLESTQPKGRNLETIDRGELDDSSSYAKAGRNKDIEHGYDHDHDHEMISMH